jgi:tetratricopeptide (TPR) repeat protein
MVPGGGEASRRLRSLLSRDPKRSAEEALLAGDRKTAMESFARLGEWKRAADLAAELGEDEKLVRFSLMDAYGRIPPGRLPDTLSAAEMLASQKHSTQAILLFERAGAFLQAGEAAVAARDPMRAVRYFKQAGAWIQAVRCYEESGKLREALQTIEEGVRSLERTIGGTAVSSGRIEELNLLKIDILIRLGRNDAVTKLLRSMPPSARLADVLERQGQHTEAVECYLGLGQPDEALRLAARAPNRDRLRAQIFLRTGQPAEAGHLLAQLGLARESAEAYELAKDWKRAAYRWEAAQEPVRAAQAYEKAGRLRDAVRCFLAAGMPERAAELSAGQGSGSGAAKVLEARGDQTLEMARRNLAAGDKTRAASLLFQIRPEEPGFPESAILLAPLLIEEGFAEQALERLRQTPRGVSPQLDVERDYWQGRSLESLEQKEAAKVCYELVMSRDASHRDVRERLAELKRTRKTTAVVSPEPPPQPVGRSVATVELPAIGGKLAGRYEILAELGRGGMGQVYKARDLELDEIVAIKALVAPAQDEMREEARFLREVQICRRITHPNVVRVYDIGRFPGGRFVTMEHIEGQSLDAVISNEYPIPFARVRFLLSEIAAGLHEAHSQGIIHRDLKPGNIIVTPTRLKILDFGIASMAGLGARLTQTGVVMGTPMYMSPDQILGREPDARSDLYSLGVLAYTLVAGREPYEPGDATLLMLQQLQAPAPPIRRFRPDTPEPWIVMLDRLLAKDPEQRYQSAQELLDVLDTLPV